MDALSQGLSLEDAISDKESPLPTGGLRLIGQAQARAAKNGKVFDVTIELTHRCNVACRHCYILPGEEELSLPEWERILRQLADHGAFVLTITGGEPTLYPRFFDFIEMTSRFGFAIRLFSNLTTLSPDDMDRLRQAHVLGVDTTIHAHDADGHDQFCRTPGAFEATLDALRRMKEKGFPLSIKTTWTRYNHKSVDRVFGLAMELGLYMRASPSVTPRRDMSTDHFDCRLSEDELFDLFLEISRVTGGDGRLGDCDSYPLPPGDVRFCGAGVTSVRIGPSGKVYPCVEMIELLGDLREQSFDEIWYQSPFLRELRGLRLRDAKLCIDCPDLRFCFRCPAQAYNEGAGLCGPSQEACRLARVSRRVFEALSAETGQTPLPTTGRIEKK